MTFWSGETLSARGQALFVPFDPDQIDCNAYVLRMGSQYFRTAEREQAERQRITSLSPNESFVIPPGQFAFLLTKEAVEIPANAMAFISMRTPIKFQGLINVSGFNVDPGYRGHLVYSVYNASPSPIQLSESELLFKMWICDIDRVSAGKYIKDPDNGYNAITGDMVRGMNREILSLQSLADKLRDQDQKVETRFAEQKPAVDNLLFVWRALQIGVIVGIIVTLAGIALSFTIPLGIKGGAALAEHLWPAAASDAGQASPTLEAPTTAPNATQTPEDDTTL